MEELQLNPGQKIYFASDFHLGAPTAELSRIRELKIIDWLDHIEKDAQAVFLVGDLFDFWFEYKQVIPKGFVRLQGKLQHSQIAVLKSTSFLVIMTCG